MAASSSSYQKKHDVFLSFRGEDTRRGFIAHLYEALCEKHIMTYKDDENLQSGQKISKLMEAISESKICIIVFSKDFASSTWCLNEVVRILECKRDGNDVIIPIFYGIEPSIVGKQEQSYAVSFANHEQRFQDNMDKVQQWRDALKEVANISGYDSKKFRTEPKLVQKIVEDVLLKLPEYQFRNDHFNGSLNGIEESVKEIESLLCIDSMDIVRRTIGIWGMGGIGKTTLASIIFQKYSYSHFEGYCFLKDVREESERCGIDHLRKILLSALLKDKAILYTDTPYVVSTFIQERFRHKKVLVVLDDVDAIPALDYLLKGFDQFANGSRIIVTSRDVQVLRTAADEVYEVKSLNDFEALELFHSHAFKQNSDLARDFATLSKEVAKYANGNPLALKVLGSSLYSKSIKDWESALEELQSEPNKDIEEVLRISFDQLSKKGKKGYTEIQNAFLDIACYFHGEVDREFVERTIDRGGASKKISDLIDKCLIIEGQNGLSMHSLIRQMGQAIVCDENEKPGKRSRLWKAEDVCHVLKRNKGSSRIEGILLNQAELEKDVKVKPKAFSKMYSLRFVRMHRDYRFDKRGILYEKLGWAPTNYKKELCKEIDLPSEGIECLFDELRYFQWDSYPLEYLPSNFSPENLVELVMRESKLEKILWNEDQPVGKLKKIDLSYSKHLIQIPNLGGAINLESIILRGCTQPSLGKLHCLDLSECENLKDGIENLPLNIRVLRLGGTAIEEVPSSIGCLLVLEDLVLKNCKRLESLPENIWKLKYLKYLDLCRCSNLEKLPEIPDDCLVSSLVYLNINWCTRLKSITKLPSCLRSLDAKNCTSLETILSWRTPTAQELGDERHNYDYEHLQMIFETYKFDECINMDRNTRNNIIAERARLRILSAQNFICDISSLEMVYPGDEIPNWFTHQSNDSWNSMNIQLPPDWFNINDGLLRFVCCVVFVLANPDPQDFIRYIISFTSNINGNVRYKDYTSIVSSFFGNE